MRLFCPNKTLNPKPYCIRLLGHFYKAFGLFNKAFGLFYKAFVRFIRLLGDFDPQGLRVPLKVATLRDAVGDQRAEGRLQRGF